MPAPLSEARKRKGRPPLPASERQSVMIGFNVRPAESAALRQAAKDRGLSLSDFLRAEVFRTVTTPA